MYLILEVMPSNFIHKPILLMGWCPTGVGEIESCWKFVIGECFLHADN